MKILTAIATLFVIGSVTGYVIELFFRRFVSQKRWVNPGFMVGPYIPLYGFGTAILYGLSQINLDALSLPDWAKIIIKLVAIGISLTLIELIAGLIFIKGMHIKLWDYSDRWGNFKGLICPIFSLAWFAIGVLYYFLLNPVLVGALYFIADFPLYVFFIGIVIGMMIVDLAYSIHLGIMIKKVADNTTVRFEQLKSSISEMVANTRKKAPFFTLHFLTKENIKEYLSNYFAKEKTEKASRKEKKQLRKKND